MSFPCWRNSSSETGGRFYKRPEHARLAGNTRGMSFNGITSEGRNRGIEEGEQRKAIAVAKNLKAIGLGDEQIAQASGRSLPQVAKL